MQYVCFISTNIFGGIYIFLLSSSNILNEILELFVSNSVGVK